jgi:hypothetical protein
VRAGRRLQGAEAAAYLAAMIDGEGSVDFLAGPAARRAVYVFNTDPDIIAAVIECCAALGIRHTFRADTSTARRKQGWKVGIYGREGLEIILGRVPIRSRRKLETLRAAVGSYKPARRRPSADELRELYVERGESLERIGEMFGYTPTQVRNWMHGLGIPRRTQQEAWVLRRARASDRAPRDVTPTRSSPAASR